MTLCPKTDGFGEEPAAAVEEALLTVSVAAEDVALPQAFVATTS